MPPTANTNDLADRRTDRSPFRLVLPAEHWSAHYRATEIVIAVGIDKPNRREVNEAAAYVVKRHGVRTRVVGKEPGQGWLMPQRRRTRRACGRPVLDATPP
jgi:putative DNA primase/helicase